MPEPRFAHLAFRCSDINRSRDFYTNALGWRFFDYRPNSESMDLTDGFINITLLPYEDDGTRSVMEEGHEFIHFGVIVEDLEEAFNKCLQWGAEISKGDVKDRTVIDSVSDLPERSFKVLDPDGNVIDVSASRDEWRCIRFFDE